MVYYDSWEMGPEKKAFDIKPFDQAQYSEFGMGHSIP